MERSYEEFLIEYTNASVGTRCSSQRAIISNQTEKEGRRQRQKEKDQKPSLGFKARRELHQQLITRPKGGKASATTSSSSFLEMLKGVSTFN